MSTPEYMTWQKTPTPENMAAVVDALDSVLNSEIQRYPGPKPLLKTKARALAVTAIKSYSPQANAKLQSWVVTQLQPLARYGQRLRPVHASEMVIRQSAELHRLGKELSDELGHDPTEDELADKAGISVKKIRYIKRSTPAVVPEAAFEPQTDDQEYSLPAVSQSNRLGSSEDAVVASLSQRDKAIYEFKTGKGGTELTNEQIARRLGVTPALVSQRSKLIADQITGMSTRRPL